MESWYVTPTYERHYNNIAFGGIGYLCMAHLCGYLKVSPIYVSTTVSNPI
jgi:hypothetical protein